MFSRTMVADSLHACGSVVLVVRAAANRDKSQVEISFLSFNTKTKHSVVFVQPIV